MEGEDTFGGRAVCTQQNIDALKALSTRSSGGSGGELQRYQDRPRRDVRRLRGLGGQRPDLAGLRRGRDWRDRQPNGACFAQVTGGACGPRYGAVCGRARFRFEQCLEAACPASDCGSGGTQACHQKAQKSACKEVTTAYAAARTNEVDLITRCGNLYGSIATSCSSSSAILNLAKKAGPAR